MKKKMKISTKFSERGVESEAAKFSWLHHKINDGKLNIHLKTSTSFWINNRFHFHRTSFFFAVGCCHDKEVMNEWTSIKQLKQLRIHVKCAFMKSEINDQRHLNWTKLIYPEMFNYFCGNYWLLINWTWWISFHY